METGKSVYAGLGEMPIEAGPLRNFLYEKTLEAKTDGELTARDSMDIEKQVIQMSQQFINTTTELKADKTYITYVNGEKRTGKYKYDPPNKTLTTYPDGRPSRTVNISFEKGFMKMQQPGEEMVMYMQKI